VNRLQCYSVAQRVQATLFRDLYAIVAPVAQRGLAPVAQRGQATLFRDLYAIVALHRRLFDRSPIQNAQFRYPFDICVIANHGELQIQSGRRNLAIGQGDGDSPCFHFGTKDSGFGGGLGIEGNHGYSRKEMVNGGGQPG